MKLKLSDPLEQYIADSLTKAGIDFVHESQDARATLNLDFFLPDHGVYLEIKGGHSPRISNQMKRAHNVIAIQGVSSVDFMCLLLSRYPIPMNPTKLDTQPIPEWALQAAKRWSSHPMEDATEEALARLIAEAHAASGWMPMDSVPLDGTVVLALAKRNKEVRLCAFNVSMAQSPGWLSLKGSYTHWQPLPAPPKV